MDYSTNYTSTVSSMDEAAIGGFVGFYVIMLILYIAIYIFSSICLGKMFKKAGITPWYAWVPFLNVWKMFEMGDKNGALIFLALIPFVGPIIFAVLLLMAIYRINQKFGKGTEYFILAFFLQIVWMAILAFDKSTWNGVSAAQISMADQIASYPQPNQTTTQPQMNNQYQPQAPVEAAPQPQQTPTYPPVNQPMPQPQQNPINDQQPPQSPNQYFN